MSLFIVDFLTSPAMLFSTFILALYILEKIYHERHENRIMNKKSHILDLKQARKAILWQTTRR